MAITVAMRTQVSQLYVSLFGRAPDAEGLGFWVKALDNGMSFANLAQQMYNTAPARAYYPEFATNQEVVRTFYQYVLGRAADAEGLAFWVAELNAAPSKGAFFTKILNNVVNYTGTDAAGLKSKALFLNKVEVAQYFGEKIGDIAGAQTALDTVTDSSATVVSAKAAIDTEAAAGDTFTLTAGTPTVVEGDSGTKVMVFELTLDRAPKEAVTVFYKTLSTGTATIGDDFQNVSSSVTFNVGQKTLTVPVVVLGDTIVESSETVRVEFSGQKLVATVVATGNIANDDLSAAKVERAVAEDGQLSGSLVAGVQGMTGQLTFSEVTGASGFALGSDGAYTFNANNGDYQGLKAGQVLNVTATYQVTNGSTTVGNSIIFIVTGTNDAPVASASVLTSFEDTVVNGNVSAMDMDNNALTYSVVTNPAHGKLLLNPDGTYTYTPSDNFNGTDSFTYKANDGTVDSNVASVTLTIANVEDTLTSKTDNLNMEASVPTDDVIIGLASSGYSADGSGSTFNQGDVVNAGAGNDTLRLFMDQGAVADGAQVSNIETLDLRLNASGDAGTASLVMTDWDDSLQQINITSNKSDLEILEQKTVAEISIRDLSTVSGASSYAFNYVEGLLDGNADTIDLTVNNVNGEDGADVFFDAGMESVNITVEDRLGNQYASNIDLDADGAQNIHVDGGRAGQSFGLSVVAANSAAFDSTTFAGNMVLDSADIETAAFGAGSDTATLSGSASSTDASFNMGEGNNTLGLDVAFAGDAMSGAGADNISADSTLSGSTIAAGNGANSVTIDGAHAGAITTGTGVDTVSMGSIAATGTVNTGEGNDTIIATTTAAGSNIQAGSGNNTILVSTHAGTIQSAEGNDIVNVQFTAAGSVILVGDGNNGVIVTVDHAGSIVAGSGTDTVTIGDDMLTGSSIAVGNGNGNKITVGGDVIDDADDTLKNTSILVGDGNTNTVEIDGSVTNSTITFGNGNDNTLEIGGDLSADAPGTVTFGNGSGNTLTVGGDIDNESVVMGTGSGSKITVDGDVVASSITVAGNATLKVEDSITDGSAITLGNGTNTVTAYSIDYSNVVTGSGADSLTLQDGIYTSSVQMGGGNDTLTLGADEATNYAVGADSAEDLVNTVVDMGAGDDSAMFKTSGDNLDEDRGYVYSNGFVQGGAGADTLTFEAQDSAKLIDRDQTQIVEVDVRKTGDAVYAVGNVVAVTFTRGTEVFTVSYTVVAADFLQGVDSVDVNVAIKLADKLTANTDFGDHFFVVEASDGVITIESEFPHEDFVITSGQAGVQPIQNSDARITSFENLNLVALDTEGASLEINANFELIIGTTNITLDSQLANGSFVEDAATNGKYTTVETGGTSTFTLENLHGGEAIVVKGNETSATGNQQVTRITVANLDEQHAVGDKITVTIGGVEVAYTVSTSNLSSNTAILDANNIARSLTTAITAAATAAGMTVARDDNQITLVGQAGEEVQVDVVHTRADVETILIDGVEITDDQTTWTVANSFGTMQAGDEVTVTIGADDFTFTLSTGDCERKDAEAIFNILVAEFGPDAVSYDWGLINFSEIAEISVERAQNIFIGNTSTETVQFATDTDDTEYDVIINAELSAEATNTTMNLSVAGTGNFDISIELSEDDRAFKDLTLKLADEHSHYIDTFGDGGNFAGSITVTDAAGVNTDGQAITLDFVLANKVDTSGSKADYSIDQYVVRNGGDDTFGDTDDYANEVITVKTAGGDDHLTTLATSALKAGSSINLGAGENSLSLGWGDDVSIGNSDLANIGNIKYSGQLNQLDILNDINLEDDSTLTLTMPGGVDNVSVLTLTDLEVNDDGEASLTIDGAATNFTIESAEDFGVDQDDLIVLEVLGVENLTMTAGDEINIRLNGAELKTVNVSAEDDTDFEMDGGEEGENAEFMNLTSIFLSAEDEVDAVLTHVRSGASLTARADANDGGEGDTYVVLSHVTLGDVHSTVGYYDSGNVNISGTTEDDVTVGNITMDTTAEMADEVNQDVNNELKIENNSVVVMQLGDISISGANTGFFIGTNTDLQLVGGDVYMSSVTGEDSFSNDNADMTIKDHTDSDITLGEITLESGSAYSEIFIDNNNKTNISLAADGLVSLMSCEGDANVYVSNNVNDHQQLGSGADANTGSESFTIELGNVNLDAGSETNLGVSGNSDETFFGDLTVRFGDINMVAYDSASLTVGEDWDGITDLGSNFATTVEMGNVDVLAKNNINVDLSNNDGTIYDLGTVYSAATRYQQDNAAITTQDVTLTSDYGSVDVEIDDNVLAVIEIGNVDAVSYGDTSEVNFNVDDNISTNFLSGSIALTATGLTSDVEFSISGNESRALLDGESAIINRYEVNGDLTVEADQEVRFTDANLGIDDNNGDAGDDAINLEIAITGDTSLTGDYADLSVASNNYVTLDFEGTVSVTSNMQNAYLELDDNDSSQITISGDVTLTSTNKDIYLNVYTNDSSEVSFAGKTTLFGKGDVELNIDSNYNSLINIGVDSETIPLAVAASYDVSLTSEDKGADFYVTSNSESLILIGDVEMKAAGDAQISISDNNSGLGGWVSIGDMSVTVEEDVTFKVIDNDADEFGSTFVSLVTIGAELEGGFNALEGLFTDDGIAVVNGSIDLEGADVGTYDGSVPDFAVDVSGNDSAVVLLGDFDITATDGDVTMRLSTGEENWLQTGSITIAASEDVYFLAEAGNGEDYLETGDIDITAGTEANEVGSVNVDSSVFFSAYDLNGTENITIDALSKGTGEADVYANIDDAYDLKSLTVSGTNAEIYLNSDIGSNNVGDDFTLDLSGLTGSFDDLISITADETDSGSTYDALGEDSDNNNGQDGGSFVSTIDAVFYGDVVVKVGTGDMIYNAQHSNFTGSDEYVDTNDTFDWNGDDGWFSLGDDLDLVPTVAGQSFYLSGYSGDPTGDSDSGYLVTSVIFDTGEREFAILQSMSWDDSDGDRGWYFGSYSWVELGGATWESATEAEVEAALGSGVEITVTRGTDSTESIGNTLITIVGAADGTDFDFIDTAVRDLGFDDDGTDIDAFAEALMGYSIGFDVTTTAGDEANDGLGNAASETFEFNADGIGEVIIGGFRANGFFEDAEVDRLDFSALADIDSAADLIITIENSGGYFDDIIIDFVNDDYGSVRLVGVGEYFTDLNVNGIANSIIFA